MKKLSSPFDSRFGSASISSPNEGAYGNPYASPPTQTSQTFNPSTTFSPKELTAMGMEMPNFLKPDPNSHAIAEQGWHDTHAHFEATQKQMPTYTVIPTHQAYIPSSRVPISPVDSSNTSQTYQVSAYAPSQSSTKTPSPPIRFAQKPVSPPVQVESRQTTAAASAHDSNYPKGQSSLHSQMEGLPRTSPLQEAPPHMPHRVSPQVSINTQVPAVTGMPRVRSPEEGGLPAFPKRISLNTNVPLSTGFPRNPTPYERAPPQFPRNTISPHRTDLPAFQTIPEMSSQMSRPALHSQEVAQHGDSSLASRGTSFIGGWKRSNSRPREASTEKTGAGSWKRSISRSRQASDTPVAISGPLLMRGGRFDLELAEKELREREDFSLKRPDVTPSSAESDEQWPGTY